MEEISLQALLEAGCHFGHKSERWHPKAKQFIYTEKDGIHIIDLAKTKAGLSAARDFVRETAARGDEVLFVATKRQAKGVVLEEAQRVGAPYLVERWIGGFLTNWDSIKKNIEKINRLATEQETGAWKKFPKHEQSKLTRYLHRLNTFYSGVLALKIPPAALFVVDIKKEIAAVREGIRRGVPVIAIVDTNADPTAIDYPIPANDDAVGSIQYITHVITQAYLEGKEAYQKEQQAEVAELAKVAAKEEKTKQEETKSEQEISKEKEIAPVEVKKQQAVAAKPVPAPKKASSIAGKRGRPKKTV